MKYGMILYAAWDAEHQVHALSQDPLGLVGTSICTAVVPRAATRSAFALGSCLVTLDDAVACGRDVRHGTLRAVRVIFMSKNRFRLFDDALKCVLHNATRTVVSRISPEFRHSPCACDNLDLLVSSICELATFAYLCLVFFR